MTSGSARPPDPDVPSPCVGICAVGHAGYCIGCYRSLDDLQRWPLAGNEERREILRRCREREEAARVPRRT